VYAIPFPARATTINKNIAVLVSLPLYKLCHLCYNHIGEKHGKLISRLNPSLRRKFTKH